MSDYIDIYAAVAIVNKYSNSQSNVEDVTADIINELFTAPTADVVEVKHGHWEHTPTFWIYCSVCGREPNEYNERVNFCPYCGADMRGQNDD